jgi:hypothetical protein
LRSRILTAVLAVAVVAVVAAAAAVAGSCRVLVALGSVEVDRAATGMTLRASGNWEFDNLVQVVNGLSFNILIVREDHFLRLHYPEGSFAGTVAGLGERVNEGIDGNDILAIEGEGYPEPTARFLSLEAQRLKISAPVIHGSGPMSVIAYLVLDGDYVTPIISNTISRPLDPVVSTNDRSGDPGTVGDPGTGAVGDPVPPEEPAP